MRKKINAAVRLVKELRLRTVPEFNKAGLVLSYVGGGSFRKVFRIKELPLVVKFPQTDGPDDDLQMCIRHSAIEVRKIAELRQFSVMRPHLPRVYYFDKAAGIVVMEYINDSAKKAAVTSTEESRIYGVNMLVARLIRALTGVKVEDFGLDNVRYDCNTRRIKLVDLAY